MLWRFGFRLRPQAARRCLTAGAPWRSCWFLRTRQVISWQTSGRPRCVPQVPCSAAWGAPANWCCGPLATGGPPGAQRTATSQSEFRHLHFRLPRHVLPACYEMNQNNEDKSKSVSIRSLRGECNICSCFSALIDHKVVYQHWLKWWLSSLKFYFSVKLPPFCFILFSSCNLWWIYLTIPSIQREKASLMLET